MSERTLVTTIHVAVTGVDDAPGTEANPLCTIDRAAQLARPGDTVRVHAGTYREWVKPRRGGLSDTRRIVYEAAPGERVIVKGSEPVTGWTLEEGTVWRADVPNSVFGSFNPFAEEVAGDWLLHPEGEPRKHLGEVYLNGRSFYEVADLPDLIDPPLRAVVRDHWTDSEVAVCDPEQTRLVWTAQVGEHLTRIWANFQGADPNAELVEVNVRRSVFYPTQHHRDYITVRGFELAQAATPWVPPTADQPALIGPNWAKGWIIEDNHIHDAKCSAISLGKEASTGDNYFTDRGDKPGYQYQLESVFAAGQLGWDREHIGSHIVRGNTIHDCGQTGIVGHLGCVFSTIADNHIHHIAQKREFYGYEIGGIKLHAPIDVEITHNRIHDCSLGIWLDWQTQGTRISRNVCYRNSRDLFVEVSHGPYLADHNLLGSAVALEILSQGGAFVNNLVAGAVRVAPELNRATPYHRPHSTQVAGFAVIHAGDDRFIGNIFLGGDPSQGFGDAADGDGPPGYGTAGYDEHPASFAEYLARINAEPAGTHRRFQAVHQPVYIRHNVYANGAQPYRHEDGPIQLNGLVTAAVSDDDSGVRLELCLPDDLGRLGRSPVAAGDLPRVRFPDADFEDRDGTEVNLSVDLLGRRRGEGDAPGPIASLAAGRNDLQVW